jgi:hypothetical protein
VSVLVIIVTVDTIIIAVKYDLSGIPLITAVRVSRIIQETHGELVSPFQYGKRLRTLK